MARVMRAIQLAPIVVAIGCAPYSVRTAEMRTQLDVDDVPHAIEALNHHIDPAVSTANGLDGDQALLRLERAMLLAETGRLAESVQDFRIADRHLDVADMLGAERDRRSRGVGVDTTGCIQGSAACPYRTIPAEKLMINAMATLVYLAMHRANDAAVEGRRIDVTRRFLDDRNLLPMDVASLASFLAAIAFDKNGHASETTSASAGEDTVIVVGYGRSPYKTSERVAVKSLASRLETVGRKDAAEQSTKDVWTTQLHESAMPQPVTLRLDDESIAPDLTWDIGREVAREWRALDEARLPSRIVPVLDCERAHPSWLCDFPPDTRNWQTLPGRFLAARVHIGAGTHRLVVTHGEKRDTIEWTSTGDGWRVLPFFFRG